jgi:hypothetical protein
MIKAGCDAAMAQVSPFGHSVLQVGNGIANGRGDPCGRPGWRKTSPYITGNRNVITVP